MEQFQSQCQKREETLGKSADTGSPVQFHDPSVLSSFAKNCSQICQSVNLKPWKLSSVFALTGFVLTGLEDGSSRSCETLRSHTLFPTKLPGS